jgi:deoxyribose-phosphate aldolase
MKKAVGNQAKVKASGGIKNYQITMEMIEAGAERIGASASIDIVEGAEASEEDY